MGFIFTMFCTRKIALFLCLAAVLLVAISPVAPILLWAIVVPLFLFCASVVVGPIDRRRELFGLPVSPVVALVAPRAPPNFAC